LNLSIDFLVSKFAAFAFNLYLYSEEDESAAMCGACLRRQVEKKGGAEISPDEWAQNTAQLAGFYVSKVGGCTS
jgi:hypothetical protein